MWVRRLTCHTSFSFPSPDAPPPPPSPPCLSFATTIFLFYSSHLPFVPSYPTRSHYVIWDVLLTVLSPFDNSTGQGGAKGRWSPGASRKTVNFRFQPEWLKDKYGSGRENFLLLTCKQRIQIKKPLDHRVNVSLTLTKPSPLITPCRSRSPLRPPPPPRHRRRVEGGFLV